MIKPVLARAALFPTGLAAFLGLALIIETLAPAAAPPAFISPRPITEAAAPAGQTGPATAWSDDILARPMFLPGRRPLTAAPAAPAAMPRLSAIVITAAGATAIFAADDGTVSAARPGGLIDGQIVKSVTANGVTLAGPAGLTILRPLFGAAAGAPGAAAPPAAAQLAPLPGRAVPLAGIPNNVDRF